MNPVDTISLLSCDGSSFLIISFSLLISASCSSTFPVKFCNLRFTDVLRLFTAFFRAFLSLLEKSFGCSDFTGGLGESSPQTSSTITGSADVVLIGAASFRPVSEIVGR